MAQANIKAVITAEDRASGALKKFGSAVDNVNDRIVHGAKMASRALGLAAAGAATFGIKTAADFETARSALSGLLGSMEEADKTMARIKKEAAATPFELTGLTEGVKQLSSVAKSGDEAIDILLSVGKAITASGGGQFELDRVVFNLKQIKGIGELSAIDLKELRRAIPIFDKLVEAAGTTVENIQNAKDPAAALFEVFEKGGKKLEAVDKAFINQGGNFNQILSNMKDSVAIFLSEFVRSTGIFDAAKRGIKGVSDFLSNNRDSLINGFNRGIDILRQWGRNISEVARQAGDYLGPKLEALWHTLNEKVLPTLERLWREVIQPLIPVIGTLLVGAIGLSIDMWNAFFTAASAVTNFLLDHEYVFWLIVGVLGAIKTALFLNGALAAFSNVIAGASAQYAGLKTLIATPLVMPAIVIAAALASLNEVRRAVEAINGAIDAMNAAANAQASMESSNAQAEARLRQLIKTGTPEQKSRALKALSATGAAGARAMGGPVSSNTPYVVGERGPELFVPNKSGSIVPNDKLGGGGTVNITVQAGAFMGSQQDARKYAKMIMDAYKDLMAGSGVMA